jgi:hypothetical protein
MHTELSAPPVGRDDARVRNAVLHAHHLDEPRRCPGEGQPQLRGGRDWARRASGPHMRGQPERERMSQRGTACTRQGRAPREWRRTRPRRPPDPRRLDRLSRTASPLLPGRRLIVRSSTLTDVGLAAATIRRRRRTAKSACRAAAPSPSRFLAFGGTNGDGAWPSAVIVTSCSSTGGVRHLAPRPAGTARDQHGELEEGRAGAVRPWSRRKVLPVARQPGRPAAHGPRTARR